MKSKGTAAMLAFFLGTLGMHRFYLRRWISGVVYLGASCTGVGLFFTVLLSMFETLNFLLMKQERFDSEFNHDIRLNELAKLSQLKMAGVINDADFEAHKARLMGPDAEKYRY